MSQDYLIKAAEQADVANIVALEQKRWQREPGVEALNQAVIQGWVNIQSPFFLIAAKDEEIHGYFFGTQRPCPFSSVNEDGIAKIEDYINPPHSTHVAEVGAISAASTHPRAMKMIVAELNNRLRQHQIKLYFGYSRISQFGRYVANHASDLPEDKLNSLALWYSLQTADLCDCPIWKETPALPSFDLPIPRRPDGVLGHHLRGRNATVLGVVPNYMTDDKSLNYAALAVSRVT